MYKNHTYCKYNRSLGLVAAGTFFLASAFPLKATSLSVLEEQAQQEAIAYMQEHGMSVQHEPAIVSGSFQKIVLRASSLKGGHQKILTFVIDPNWDGQGRLPIKSVTIR